MLLAFWLAGIPAYAGDSILLRPTNSAVRVVIVSDSAALVDYVTDDIVVHEMVDRGITNLTGQATVAAAWHSLVSTKDVVGIKVYSAGGEISGTRPAVVTAVVHDLLDAGLQPNNIVIWDKYTKDLHDAGFFKLARQLGVRVAGCVETGFDPTNFYLPESPVIGNLRYGDLEFGKKGDGVGRKSFVSLLVSRQFTKIISIAPLLNDNNAGVCGQLYSVSLGSVDNTARFEGDPGRLAVAVPEIYALHAVGDRVVLNISDALMGQYEQSRAAPRGVQAVDLSSGSRRKGYGIVRATTSPLVRS